MYVAVCASDGNGWLRQLFVDLFYLVIRRFVYVAVSALDGNGGLRQLFALCLVFLAIKNINLV